ncbi:MAG TPA: OmpH family outer membrane protein [Candidatus Acidoferrales bacterium]|nr:OmpH family outer membrane protein [Candidatus Acidoferrales bacterium]
MLKMRFVIPVFAALAFSSIAGAQTASKAADAPAKIGVIDFQGAIAGTAEGKKDASQLQTEFAPRQQELANISKQIDDLNTKLRTGQNTLSDDEKARIQTQINQFTQSGQRKQQDLSDDMNAREQDFVQEIGSKMVQVVDKYAKENGYTMVIDGGSQQSTVVWAAPEVNITQPIISLYDSTYPAKTSSTTAPSSSAPHTTPAHPSGAGSTTKP